MILCSYCGSRIGENDKICTNCGAPLSASVNVTLETTQTSSQEDSLDNSSDSASGDDHSYEVILVDLGSCGRTTCNDLLEDFMGYSDLEAEELINHIPARIGYSMSYVQAKTLCQGLEEYGADLAVLHNGENVDIGGEADHSIFNTDGSLIASALSILSTLTKAHRVKEYTTWKKPNMLQRLYHSFFRKKEPPKHVRRTVYHGAIVPRKDILVKGGKDRAPVPVQAPRVARERPSHAHLKKAQDDLNRGQKDPLPPSHSRDDGRPGRGGIRDMHGDKRRRDH